MLRDTTRDDRGAVAVVVAISLVMLFTFAALAVDLGLWMTAKRQLQSAADGAALAGCRDLSDGKSEAEIWATVVDYANRNFSVPVDPAASVVAEPTPGGDSEIGADYVKVTVRTVAPSFFAKVFGTDEGQIAAQSVAKVGYLAGVRSPVPWGLLVMNVGEMSGTIGGEGSTFWDQSGGLWAGGFSQGRTGKLTISARNSLGYVETFPASGDFITVAALSPTGRIAAVDVEKTTFTSGVDSTCDLEVALSSELAVGGTVKASAGVGGLKNLTLDPVTGTYKGTVDVPSTQDPFVSAPLTIEVKEGGNTETKTARILVRRANYILEDVSVEPLFAMPTDSVSVAVQSLDFDYGVSYPLKVEGGAGTTGNFQALNFSSLSHSECGLPDTPVPGGAGGSDYKQYIVGDPNLQIHLNDWVDTEPGNMVGPTKQGISERLQGHSLLTFEQWEDAKRPESAQLLLIPILEKPSAVQGRSDLKVISFATFFLEQGPQGSQDTVVGRFVEYASPGWVVVPNPPGPLAIPAVHLVTDHLDF